VMSKPSRWRRSRGVADEPVLPAVGEVAGERRRVAPALLVLDDDDRVQHDAVDRQPADRLGDARQEAGRGVAGGVVDGEAMRLGLDLDAHPLEEDLVDEGRAARGRPGRHRHHRRHEPCDRRWPRARDHPREEARRRALRLGHHLEPALARHPLLRPPWGESLYEAGPWREGAEHRSRAAVSRPGSMIMVVSRQDAGGGGRVGCTRLALRGDRRAGRRARPTRPPGDFVAVRSALRAPDGRRLLWKEPAASTLPPGPVPVARRCPGRNGSDALKVRPAHSRS
jgi:hypothetical protein